MHTLNNKALLTIQSTSTQTKMRRTQTPHRHIPRNQPNAQFMQHRFHNMRKFHQIRLLEVIPVPRSRTVPPQRIIKFIVGDHGMEEFLAVHVQTLFVDDCHSGFIAELLFRHSGIVGDMNLEVWDWIEGSCEK